MNLSQGCDALNGAEIVPTLAGRTIVNVETVCSHGGWDEHWFLRLFLDDGRAVEIHGWGYDAWGIDLQEARLD